MVRKFSWGKDGRGGENLCLKEKGPTSEASKRWKARKRKNSSKKEVALLQTQNLLRRGKRRSTKGHGQKFGKEGKRRHGLVAKIAHQVKKDSVVHESVGKKAVGSALTSKEN